jgi:hypothetical protein
MQPVERDKSSGACLLAEPSGAKPQTAPMQIDDGGDGDSEPEPDTEDDEYPPPAGFLAGMPSSSNSQIRQPAQASGSSQSQADSQQRRLSSAGLHVKVESQNGIMVDDDSDELEDYMSRAVKARLEREARKQAAAAAKKREEEEAAWKAEQRRVMQEQIAAGLREMQASGHSLLLPSDEDDEEEDAKKRELAVQAVRTSSDSLTPTDDN